MCGIVGYVGSEQCAPILLDGLRRLEYRGYDSAGLAVQTPKGTQVVRAVVVAHGGSITAENRPGGGAMFRFSLPIEGEPLRPSAEE